MKTLLDLVTSARAFALETINDVPSPALTTRALQAFQDAGLAANEDWLLWNETVNTERALARKIQNDPLPSTTAAQAKNAAKTAA